MSMTTALLGQQRRWHLSPADRMDNLTHYINQQRAMLRAARDRVIAYPDAIDDAGRCILRIRAAKRVYAATMAGIYKPLPEDAC